MPEITTQSTHIPVFHKKSGRLAIRVSEEGVWVWSKDSRVVKEWELFTWEELRAKIEAEKQRTVTV
jgi:hypothetical protein